VAAAVFASGSSAPWLVLVVITLFQSDWSCWRGSIAGKACMTWAWPLNKKEDGDRGFLLLGSTHAGKLVLRIVPQNGRLQEVSLASFWGAKDAPRSGAVFDEEVFVLGGGRSRSAGPAVNFVVEDRIPCPPNPWTRRNGKENEKNSIQPSITNIGLLLWIDRITVITSLVQGK
jgi:hypothetical protein